MTILEDLSNDFKYQQLEIIYYQALNAEAAHENEPRLAALVVTVANC